MSDPAASPAVMSAEAVDPAVHAAVMPALDADAVFFALAHPGRRLLLQLLAQQRSATAAEIVPTGRLKRDATGKQLHELVKAGLVTRSDDAKDARRLRFTLLPGLTATRHASGGWEMDLGCCILRWA